MSEHIEPIEIAPETFRSLWGVTIVDYKVNGAWRDFETLIVKFSTSRASTIEGEINPLSTRIQDRNQRLSLLGNALADLSTGQTQLAPDDKNDETFDIKPDTLKILAELDSTFTSTTLSKPQIERAVQTVKTEIDRLNNDSSSDMSTLQSLVDKRDESFSNASSLMQAVSDCRSSAIRNMQ